MKVWDLAAGAEILTLPAGETVSGVALTPDGRQIVAACQGDNSGIGERRGRVAGF